MVAASSSLSFPFCHAPGGQCYPAASGRPRLNGQPCVWYGGRCLGRYDPTGSRSGRREPVPFIERSTHGVKQLRPSHVSPTELVPRCASSGGCGPHSPSFQQGVEPQPVPCPPRRPVVTAICCRPHSHCAWVPKGPWVAAVSTPPGCWETTMNHQNATIAARLTNPLLPIVSSSQAEWWIFMPPPGASVVTSGS